MVDDAPLTREDVILHFLNGQCASRKAPGCSEVAHAVRSPIRLALTITETIVIRCERKQIPLDDLRRCCSAIGMTTTRRPEYEILTQKLKTRCNALRPLLDCDELDKILCGVETMAKQALQHLCIQHDLDVDPKCNAESMKTTIVDHVASGGCQASTSSLCSAANDEYHEKAPGANGDLEAYIINHAAHAKDVKPSKKTLRRILKSKDIEFDNDDEIGDLRRHLRSYLTTLRKGKKSEWSRNQRTELESERCRRLDEI